MSPSLTPPLALLSSYFAAHGLPVRPVPAHDAGAWERLGAPRLKTLLVRDKRGTSFWLAALPMDARLDAEGLRAALGTSKLSVATGDDLAARVGVPSGAVSPLALALPAAAGLPLLLDASVADAPAFLLHPGDPDVRWHLSAAELGAFFASVGCVPRAMPLALVENAAG